MHRQPVYGSRTGLKFCVKCLQAVLELMVGHAIADYFEVNPDDSLKEGDGNSDAIATL